MLNQKLKTLQNFLQDASDSAFEFTKLNSKFAAMPTTYGTHFQNVLSARSTELSVLLHDIAITQAKKLEDEPEDWFYNSKTGEVYYNSTYKNGDESLLGKNWEHFGKNKVFGTDDITLLKDFSVSGNFEAITGYLDAKKGKKFMKEQGYNFNPVQEVVYHKDLIIPVKLPVPVTIEFQIIEKSKYMSNNYFESGKGNVNNFLFRDTFDGHETVGRYEIYYSNNKIERIFINVINVIAPSMSPAIYNSWKEFTDKNNKLINEFIFKYDKK